jgi:nitrogen regulatory protein P-II 1
MKKIEAIIQPCKLDDVKLSLGALDTTGLTVAEVKGCGLQNGHPDRYRSVGAAEDSSPKVKIEIITDDDKAMQVANAIERAAHTGRHGDGLITIIQVDDAVRIRTGERGPAAI